MKTASTALYGKTILVTRAAHQITDLTREIERYCGTTFVFSTVEIVPVEKWEIVDKAIDALYKYDGFIFTSTNGVKHFFNRLSDRAISLKEIKTKKIYVVGSKTGDEIRKLALIVTTMPERFSAHDLVKILQTEDLNGKTYLYPSGNLGKNLLAKNLNALGAQVDTITVYQTSPASKNNIEQLRSALFAGKINVATFTSPSTFQNFVSFFSTSELNKIRENLKIAVIGPITASSVIEFGWQPDIVAEHSTSEAFAKAIANYYVAKKVSGVKK
jgi:uroporphyrinogen III methyltransferase / synthase